MLPVFYWNIHAIVQVYKENGYRAYTIMTLNQCLNLAGVLSITFAVSSGYVTLVNAIAAVQPFFVLMFATLLSCFFPRVLFEEHNSLILLRMSVALVMILGGVVMVL